MSALTTQFCEVLRASEVLAPLIAERVYNNRPLKRTGAGATPEAFDPNGRVRLSLVVMDEGSMGDFARDDAAEQTVTVWCHGPTGEGTLELMDGMVYTEVLALLDYEFTATNGTGIDLAVQDRFGVQEDPTLANTYVDFVRFAATRLWR